ncbi:MAG: hypothetical protein HY673_12120 [Chloroflexi bacterium]|nr:hypothetical protein [Chloroflexota bacterium]
MAEEIGKIEKPDAGGFQAGRRLFFIPLLFSPREALPEFQQLVDKYWNEVESQLSNLELKLGRVTLVYHELIPAGGAEGAKAMEELNSKSYAIARPRLENAAVLEAMEDAALLTEFMDWGKCLSVGLQNEKVFQQVYDAYTEASKKRTAHIAAKIAGTLKENQIGLLLMREGHQVQFAADIQVFYISPPSLDEIKRWLRARENEK